MNPSRTQWELETWKRDFQEQVESWREANARTAAPVQGVGKGGNTTLPPCPLPTGRTQAEARWQDVRPCLHGDQPLGVKLEEGREREEAGEGVNEE